MNAGAGVRSCRPRASAFARAHAVERRRRGCSIPRLFACTLSVSLLAAAPPGGSYAAAQDPPPRPDTLRVPRADTIPDVEQQDTVIAPAVQFPAMPVSPRISAAGTEWVWDRETLLREAHVNLVDLLERIPGVTAFRGGMFVQPEVASALGGTAARMEVVIDGYIIDPLAGTTFDLSQIALGHLREVRVQRRLGLLRIILTTEHPVLGQPYTRVEAGIGIPPANLFRGLFLVPHVIIGPLGLGIERLDTEGTRRAEPAGLFSGWAKWAWTNGDRGVQVEWRRGTLRRETGSPWVVDRVRQDVVIRARNQVAPGFVGEIYAGRSTMDETVPSDDTEQPDVHTERSSIQAGARVGLQLPWAVIGGAVRYRSLGDLPVADARVDLESWAGPLRVSADASLASWDGERAGYGGARAEIGGLFATSGRNGASAFAEITRGTRGAPVYDDDLLDGHLLASRSGWRVGAALDLGRVAGSAALITLEQGAARPFGTIFDRAAPVQALGRAQGLEAHGRVVIWRDYLTLSSWITDWRSAEGWTYLPSRSWRTALELHALPLPSGNLEIFGRAEAHMRGSALAFDPAALDGAGSFIRMPAYTTADAYLQIRVIAVRAFIRWEDILGNAIEDLPGRIQHGPRIFYGVKWELWN